MSFDFAPHGSVAAIRATKFARYLQDFGWAPVVLTSTAGSTLTVHDPGLLEGLGGVEIHRVWAPRRPSFLSRSSSGAEGASGVVHRRRRGPWHPSSWIVPDEKIAWLPPALAWAARRRDRPCDVVLSTLPIPSAVLVGWLISKLWSVPHVVDYRDPWTGVHYRRRLRPLAALERALERRVLADASALTGAHDKAISELDAAEASRVTIIPNGFDEADFAGPPPTGSGPPTIAHVGLLREWRGVGPLVETLVALSRLDPAAASGLRFVQAGSLDVAVRDELRRLPSAVSLELRGLLPHGDAVGLIRSADLLYLPSMGGNVPSKTYEYVRSGRPILAAGPPGSPLQSLLEDVGARAHYLTGANVEAGADFVASVLAERRSRAPSPPPGIAEYARRSTARRMARVLDSTLSPAGHDGAPRPRKLDGETRKR